MDIAVYIKSKKVDVKATYNTETREVVVKKGSKILNFYQRELKDSLANTYMKKVEEMKKDGTIIQDDVFVKDYTFSSLSVAASVIQGNNRNGRDTFLMEGTNQTVGTQLDNENDLIEYIYENLDGYEEIEQEAKAQTEQFQEKYPLEDLKNLTLEEYDRNGNSNSFMNMIENRTNAYASGNLNSNYNKIFAHLGEDNYYVKNKILDNVENINLTEREMFKKYITKCYEYIKNFNKETYYSIEDYPGKEYLDGSNIIKMKLILNYLGPVITGITSVDVATDIVSFLNIPYHPKSDSVDLNIKITNYIGEKSPELKEYIETNPYALASITAIIKDYYGKFIKPNKKYYVGGAVIDGKNVRDILFDKQIFAIGWKKLGDLRNYQNSEQIYKKVAEISSEAKELKNFKYTLTKLKEMKRGDKVLLKTSYTANHHQDSAVRVFAIGQVQKSFKEGYEFISEIGHSIPVEWEVLEEPKEVLASYRRAIQSIDEQKFKELEIKIWEEDQNDEEEIENENTFRGFNKIYYGAPGCGKSYIAKEEAESEQYYKCRRILFHPEYTYADFIGQLQPIVIEKEVIYDFVPGPFTEILGQALKHPNRNYCLLIEEINRGNTSAIFGDILQLLDRKEGESEYPITNSDIMNYLKEKVGLQDCDEIKIPSNLSIIGTMNSNDQNVFTLDTAFKRRWCFKRIANDFKKHDYKTKIIEGTNITWEKFVTTINRVIVNPDSINDEDKQIGQYFVSEAELADRELFAEKVLFYLWEDVVRFDKSLLFDTQNYKTLDRVIQGFIEHGLGVFNQNIFDGENDNEE